MSAAQNNRIYPVSRNEIIHVVLDGQVHDIVIYDALFYKRHIGRTRSLINIHIAVQFMYSPLILTAGYGNFGSNNAHIVSAAAGISHLACCRLYDSYYGYLRKPLLQFVNTRCTDSVAGDDNHLHIFAHQKLRNLIAKSLDGACSLGAVRCSGSVSEIYDFLFRKLLHKRSDTCQTTQSRIKKSYRSIVHKTNNPPGSML